MTKTFSDGTPEQLNVFYRKLSTRQLKEIVDRITDQIDCNPERIPVQVAAADEARERRALIQAVIDGRTWEAK